MYNYDWPGLLQPHGVSLSIPRLDAVCSCLEARTRQRWPVPDEDQISAYLAPSIASSTILTVSHLQAAGVATPHAAGCKGISTRYMTHCACESISGGIYVTQTVPMYELVSGAQG
ncbi:hypothetical protein VTO73DRAFT_2434 [Trametes versicolor]